jgi:diguanylate cyclase (GGDEF)-like protein
LGFFCAHFAFAYNESAADVVRVGYALSEGFQEGGEGEQKYGYGYEYLQKIAYYTGWNYEYVYGSFTQCLEMLKNGEIDLMGDIPYTTERAQTIFYSTEAQGDEFYYLYTRKGQTDLDAQDLSTLDGMRVGVSADSHQVLLFQQWCFTRNIQCQIVEYTDVVQRTEDLNNGSLDATIGSDALMNEDWVPLTIIGSAPYYFGVSQQRPDILAELNEALDIIQTANPYYNDDLRSKYSTGSSLVMLALTGEEQNWLNQTGTIRIGYLSDYMPYCGTDAAGQLDGLLDDLLDSIVQEYSLPYEAVSFDNYGDMTQALYSGRVDAIFPVFGDYSIAESLGAMVTDAVATSTMIVFNNMDTYQPVSTLALTHSDPFQNKYATLYYPDAQILALDTVEDCVNAVLDGQADFTIVETAKVNESQTILRKAGVQEADLQKPINISFAVRRGDIHLLSILNKGLACTDDTLLTNSLIYHSQRNVTYTTMDFLREHIVPILVFLVAVFGAILGTMVAYFTLRSRSQKQLWEAEREAQTVRWKADHDSLTGLRNRAAFSDLCEKLRSAHRPLGLLVIDVDKFKDVNDTYGHETGDRALIQVAQVLVEHFRAEDCVVRYAGDEFVVLLPGMTAEKFPTIGDKLDEINRLLQNPPHDLPSLSISVGAAFSPRGYEDTLFQRADQALYRAKENGRGGYCI